MRRVTLTAVAASAAAAMALMAVAYTQQKAGESQEPKYAGLVLEVKKSCVVRDHDGARPQTLAGAKAAGTKLRAGQQLQCAQGGRLKFRYVASGMEVVVTQTHPDWHTVVNVPARKNFGAPGGRPGGRISEYYRMPTALELTRYGEGHGLARALPGLISPTEGWFDPGVVNANANANASPRNIAIANSNANANYDDETVWLAMKQRYPSESRFSFTPPTAHRVSVGAFSFRWSSLLGDIPVELSLRDAQNGELIWGPLTATTGRRAASTPEMRDALRAFRANHPGRVVKLVALHLGQLLDEVEVSLLSAEEEGALAQELDAVGKAAGLAERIERADVFASRGLLAEAADEYEAALAQSPENDDLLVATALAQCRIQNQRRLYELVSILRPRVPVSSAVFSSVCNEPRRP